MRLTTFPLRVEDIQAVIPMGMMVHGHVTPTITPVLRHPTTPLRP